MNRQQVNLLTLFFFLVALGIGVSAYSLGGAIHSWKEQARPLQLMPPPSLSRQLSETRKELQQALTLLSACFGRQIRLSQIKTSPVTITAYSSTPDQTDSTPHITATNDPVRVGILAISLDLKEELGISFGQRVLLPGFGVFEVRDVMNPRFRRRVDIWESDREAARLFGKKKGVIIWAAEEGPAAQENPPSAASNSLAVKTALLNGEPGTP